MTNPNEIAALKASFAGALRTAESLAALRARIDALDPQGDISGDDLEELTRVTAAHSLASAALRGLVETMRTRRGVGVTAEHAKDAGGDG
jgi:hypothetical protein